MGVKALFKTATFSSPSSHSPSITQAQGPPFYILGHEPSPGPGSPWFLALEGGLRGDYLTRKREEREPKARER